MQINKIEIYFDNIELGLFTSVNRMLLNHPDKINYSEEQFNYRFFPFKKTYSGYTELNVEDISTLDKAYQRVKEVENVLGLKSSRTNVEINLFGTKLRGSFITEASDTLHLFPGQYYLSFLIPSRKEIIHQLYSRIKNKFTHVAMPDENEIIKDKDNTLYHAKERILIGITTNQDPNYSLFENNKYLYAAIDKAYKPKPFMPDPDIYIRLFYRVTKDVLFKAHFKD